MCKRTVLTIVAVAMLALTMGQVQAETIDINGEFIMYKPGTDYTVTATFQGGYASGVGDNIVMKGGGTFNYSDGTTGTVVDVPGWKVVTGNPDLTTGGLDDSTGFNAFGTWSGGTGTTAESADSLGVIGAGTTYTLSAMVNGSGGPLVLDLLADGEALIPSFSITPSLPTGEWQEISRTYNAGAVGEYVGQAMTIVLGTGAENLVGTRIVFDNVSFSYEPLGPASNPAPADEATDVVRDVVLGWTPGVTAASRSIYFGETFDAVNDALLTDAVSVGQITTTYEPGRLDFLKTYYWRGDEVNGTPDKTVFKGDVWSFTVEPMAVPIETVTATASGANADMGPEKTIDGSGLNELDQHSSIPQDMWLTQADGSWIQYEFDRAYKMHDVLIWNSNQVIESFIGFGVKETLIETSLDGVTWTAVEGVGPFAQGTVQATYEANTTVDLSGRVAKYVKISPQSAHGMTNQAGLGEVRFFAIPTAARELQPAPGAVDESIDTTLSWRAGREATLHEVYIGTDPADLALVASTDERSVMAENLVYDQTYYWQIAEVNEAEAPARYTSDIQSFSTSTYGIVDDFESYSGKEGQEVFLTWFDGYGGDSSLGGSTTGYFDGPFVETTRVDSGGQAMPFYYDNDGDFFDIDGKVSSPAFSEVVRDFDTPQDWTAGEAQLLSIAFFGEADNTGTLYAKINGTKVTYPFEPAHIAAQSWKTWNIDLSALGINAQRVTSLAIGVDGGKAGMLLIDTLVLRLALPVPEETVSLANDFDALPVGSSMHDVPGWEGWFGDAQWAAKVTDAVAYSGTNSLEIVGARDDLVPHWPLVENGVYEASVMQYVPTGTDGLMHFGPLSSYGSSWDDTAWLGTLLTNCTTDSVYVNELDAGTRTEAPLLRDQWVLLRIVMNFDGNACDFYYGDTLLGSLECPSAMGFDIWPDDDVDVLYYDDFRFESPE